MEALEDQGKKAEHLISLSGSYLLGCPGVDIPRQTPRSLQKVCPLVWGVGDAEGTEGCFVPTASAPCDQGSDRPGPQTRSSDLVLRPDRPQLPGLLPTSKPSREEKPPPKAGKKIPVALVPSNIVPG